MESWDSMRQTLTLYNTTSDNYIIQTVSREQVINVDDGDYDITSDLRVKIIDLWGDVSMSDCRVMVVNG